MKTCFTCKFWMFDENRPYDVRRLGMGVCDATPMFFNSMEWTGAGDRVFSQGVERTTAFVQDSSDYRAYLYTRKDHGCTMHEVVD